MLSNKKLMEKLAQQLGEDNIIIEKNKNAWPALCKIKTGDIWENVAIHFRRITLSHRNRDETERRFQNSETHPIQSPTGYKPLLVGGWLDDTEENFISMAGFEVSNRIGRKKRNSYFIPLEKLKASLSLGWMTHTSKSGEKIHIFRPELLPVFSAIDDGSETPPGITTISVSSGLTEEKNEASAKRARRSAFAAIRSQKFSKKVKKAYDYKCAMCNLGAEVVEGAHLYPVEADHSQDEIWNGTSLCRNHHRLFDIHKIAIEPTTWKIKISPDLKLAAQNDKALMRFLDETNEKINLPKDPNDAPREEMLKKRYEFYKEDYKWMK